MGLDGHFWVVQNGKIIDPYFKEYDQCKSFWKCGGERIYLPADDLIQKVMKVKYIDSALTIMNTNRTMWEMRVYGGVQPNSCNINAILEVMKNGGEIVFGSMGWEKNDGSGVHYEFGGENWTIAKFLGK